jgi:hypothetical protein
VHNIYDGTLCHEQFGYNYILQKHDRDLGSLWLAKPTNQNAGIKTTTKTAHAHQRQRILITATACGALETVEY